MMADPGIIDELSWRQAVHGATEGAPEALGAGPMTAYVGFDPTASSLHVGSLLPVMCLARLQRHGHTPIALVGGGTGLIGDPSGKTQERQLLTAEQVTENVAGIRGQLERFLDFDVKTNPATIVDNGDWLTRIGLTDFLRDIGKYFRVGYMLDKESVKRRLESDEGISFTEFSYMLMQAYDYLVLHDRHGCTLQLGGSDQWGNITAGIELIRKLRSERAYGVVFPLVTTSKGVKFGKTDAGTIWLAADRTSPYRFYQFWLNTDDRDVVTYLRYFTWLDAGTIDELVTGQQADPSSRVAQRRLAREMTRAVHGETECERAEQAAAALFGGELGDLGGDQIEEIFADVPSTEVAVERLAGAGISLAELLVETGIASSKGDARRAIEGGGIYLNNQRHGEARAAITSDRLIDGRFLVLRKGQKNYHLVRLRT